MYASNDLLLTVHAGDRSSGDGMSQQARLGLHTMRAGDRVTYNHLEDGESYETAWVMAVVYKPKSAREQAHKFVILFEPSSSIFFLQGCNSWKRVAKSNTTLDPDEPEFHCATVTTEERNTMATAWDCSSQLQHIVKLSDAQNACKIPPPDLVVQGREREKQEKVEKKRLKAESVKAKALAEKAEEQRKLAAAREAKKQAEAEAAATEAEEKRRALEQKRPEAEREKAKAANLVIERKAAADVAKAQAQTEKVLAQCRAQQEEANASRSTGSCRG